MTNILSFEELLEEANYIQSVLDSEIPSELEARVQRGDELAGYISRSGNMIADAKFHLDSAMRSSTMDQLKQIGEKMMPASTLNNFISANCAQENRLFKWCERLNATATHQLDWIRSVVSKEKEEMRLSGYFNNKQ